MTLSVTAGITSRIKRVSLEASITRKPTYKDVIVTPAKERGQCVHLNKEGWQEYVKILNKWWKEGPCLIQRKFQYDHLDHMWAVLLYHTKASEYEVETKIIGTAQEKHAVRVAHNDINSHFPAQLTIYASSNSCRENLPQRYPSSYYYGQVG